MLCHLRPYLRRNSNIPLFKRKEKELVIIRGQSSLFHPYQTHNASPVINRSSMMGEISPAFFSRIVLINWGIMEIEVITPAAIPIMFGLMMLVSCCQGEVDTPERVFDPSKKSHAKGVTPLTPKTPHAYDGSSS
jgi:hypothetical protein